jgi:ADP-ribose pyrophosphatase YjhB (NUDIX family)
MQQKNINYCQKCGAILTINDNRSKYCSKCNLYYYSFPTACVVLLLYTNSRDYLFIERSKDPDKGKLDFPGSFIRIDEDVETACNRVAEEEISLNGLSLKYFGSSYDYYGGNQDIPIISLLFKCKIDEDIKKKISPKNDASKVKFIHKDKIITANLAYPSMIEEIEKLERYIEKGENNL